MHEAFKPTRRESEWCLFADEDLELVTASIEVSDWSNLDVVRTGFMIHLMEPLQGMALN